MARYFQLHPKRRSSNKKEFGEKELEELRTAFNLIDSNKDGKVNVDEIKNMLQNLGIAIKDEKIHELIRCASRTGNELLDENDFMNWVKRIQELLPEETMNNNEDSKDLVEAFRVFDLDKNGFITRDELRRAMEMIGEALTETQLTQLISLADTDKDGRINYEEFARLLT